MQLCSCQNISHIVTQCFFTDHLNHKTVNKTTFRTPLANLHLLCAHWLKNFPTLMIIFSEFPDLFGKVFLVTRKFS